MKRNVKLIQLWTYGKLLKFVKTTTKGKTLCKDVHYLMLTYLKEKWHVAMNVS
jgi:hypothetical protein